MFFEIKVVPYYNYKQEKDSGYIIEVLYHGNHGPLPPQHTWSLRPCTVWYISSMA